MLVGNIVGKLEGSSLGESLGSEGGTEVESSCGLLVGKVGRKL